MASLTKRKRTKQPKANSDKGMISDIGPTSSKYFCSKQHQDTSADISSSNTVGISSTGDNTATITEPTQSSPPKQDISTKARGDGQANGPQGLRLHAEFFDKQCVDLARALLGQRLVHVLESGERLAGVIVETEAYCGVEDKAAHSYQGKRTARTEAMFMKPGTAYVYSIYGCYCCMNISSIGEGCAVLLRAIEPTDGLEKMRELRSGNQKSPDKLIKDKDLGNGPSKLCMALGIKKDVINQQDMTSSSEIWLEEGDNSDSLITVVSKRINISYGEDWVEKPLRFYILDNKCVSVRDKEADKKARGHTSQ